MPNAPVNVIEDGDFRAEIWKPDADKPEYIVHYLGPNGKDFGKGNPRAVSSPSALADEIKATLAGLRQKYPHGITETEYKIIEILTQCGEVRDAWTEPFFAVDRAMGWATATTRAVVDDLIGRKLLVWNPIARDGPIFDPKACWKKGKAFPKSEDSDAG